MWTTLSGDRLVEREVLRAEQSGPKPPQKCAEPSLESGETPLAVAPGFNKRHELLVRQHLLVLLPTSPRLMS